MLCQTGYKIILSQKQIYIDIERVKPYWIIAKPLKNSNQVPSKHLNLFCL